MSEVEKFIEERSDNIQKIANSQPLKEIALDFIEKTGPYKYSYNFSWLGRPIIQYPQDIMAMQEIIWEVQPDLIIETGIAHGGSLIFSASMLELIGKDGQVLGIDIDIREHNKTEIEKHPMAKRISMIQGSSVDPDVISVVKKRIEGKRKIMVCLDSNHTHAHVLKELELYSPFVSLNSYLVVFDTIIEDLPSDYNYGQRHWGKGNSPKTAVREFLESNKNFEIDKAVDGKLLISVAPDGYLKRIK